MMVIMDLRIYTTNSVLGKATKIQIKDSVKLFTLARYNLKSTF